MFGEAREGDGDVLMEDVFGGGPESQAGRARVVYMCPFP